MLRLVNSYRITAFLHVAAELGLADLLAEEAKTSADLARATGAHEPSLRRLLKALAAMEVLEEEGGRFRLTPLGEELRSVRLRDFARFFGWKTQWAAWGEFQHSVMTGERAFDHVFGMPNWDYYVQHPDAGARFDAAMNAMTSGQAERIVAAYDFSQFGTVVDVGGGDGTLLAEILRANPGVWGVLYDRPDVVARARPRLEAMGLSARCRLEGGNFLERVPEQPDAYVMKSILHDWDDEGVKQIVSRCREAGGARARLVVVERVLPDTVSPDALEALASDLNMMVSNGGMERTEAEYREVLGAGGYRLQRVLPTGTVQSVLEAVPAT
jgi:O-methyltransferase domain/Dimerisation domain